jgi:hypothetical protein
MWFIVILLQIFPESTAQWLGTVCRTDLFYARSWTPLSEWCRLHWHPIHRMQLTCVFFLPRYCGFRLKLTFFSCPRLWREDWNKTNRGMKCGLIECALQYKWTIENPGKCIGSDNCFYSLILPELQLLLSSMRSDRQGDQMILWKKSPKTLPNP